MKFFETLQTVNIGSFSLASILSAVVVFVICHVVIKTLNKVAGRALEKTKLDNSVKHIAQTAIRLAAWSIAVIIIADTLGIPTTSLVAVISVAGLALSLAIQDIMSNLFNGITILMTKPFVSGDYVEFDTISGTIHHVGLFYTTITTVDNRVVYVPNRTVSASKIYNYSKESLRRVDRTFCAAYDCSTEAVKSAIMEAIRSDAKILASPEPFIAISNYLDSSIEYTVRVWCNNADYWDVYFNLNEAVRESFIRNHVEMSYGHLNIHVCKD